MSDKKSDENPYIERFLGREELTHKRYEWLDQFRGLIILFLIISVITWPLSGDAIAGDPIVGPPLLNHGFQYAKYYPAIITIIDIGQQIFMFCMGFVAYLAFSGRSEKKGVKDAWKHGLIRVAILYLIAFLDDGLIGGDLLSGGTSWINSVLWSGTLANLAIGTFAAYLAVYLVKDADKRLYIGLAIMILHGVLFALPFFDHYGPSIGDIIFPFNALNHVSIAIIATSFSQWYKMDPNDPRVGFKKRILPVSAIAIAAFYCLDWVQAAEHHDVTTSLALLAIATSGFMISVFYFFETIDFKVPMLSEMGRNMLILFIGAFFYGDLYVQIYPKDFLLASPLLALILVGIIPIAIGMGIALLLDKKNIKIKI
jgi:hypothetical protein